MINNLKIGFHKLKFYSGVNWPKTLYFNFKKFPYRIAKKLPVFFYGKVKFTDISGEVEIAAPIRKGMIGFGQPYEMNTLHKGIAEISLIGKLVFKGHLQFGKDYFIYIGKGAYCEFGHMASMASNAKLIAIESVILGDFARFGSESQIMDTNFHQMIDTSTGERYKVTEPVVIGNYNYIGNRVSVMPGAQTPNYCTVASNSVCNKDFSKLEENILLAGMPAKLIRNMISRDWNAERESLEDYLTIR
ncbi:acetyltransferase-like isoleucine patch superfamily enzyme [Flavobacterium sp. 28A]|uniref:acyltransferase n=1 Tax=Flavobacterium sp. 28A TaxID=2735895 RepID=UPI0015702B04|nr:transferase [Flavobacterium sp. 28A]NRT17051.1 acetyltransferase-like isoleucine patch superfamily enzyme [Flavobacterium sp. 28A]